MNDIRDIEEYHIYNVTNRYVYLVSGPRAKEQLVLYKKSFELGIIRTDISRIRKPVLMKIEGFEIILTEKEHREIYVKKLNCPIRDAYDNDQRVRIIENILKLRKQWAYKQVLKANVVGRQRCSKKTN
jgi:hypothetical protein